MATDERPAPEARVARLRGHTVPARVDKHGRSGPTRGELTGPLWRRSSHGFYVPASVDSDVPEQRIVEAAAVLPGDGGVTGWAALRWHGARWFDGSEDGSRPLPVTVAISYLDVRPQPGIAVSHEQLRPSDLEVLDGLSITVPERSALYEMRHAPTVEDAVSAADMAMEADVVDRETLAAYAATLRTWTGIPQAREALLLARENSWSPQETRLRMLWIRLAGLPEPLCNQPVFDLAGRHIGTPDLLDPVAGVAGEYEGVVHLERRRRGLDVRREQAFLDAGLECFPVVATDWKDEAVIAARIRSAYARAAHRVISDRAWTIEQPYWWIPTDTVARRRALSGRERQVWLSRRAG
jgi:hypothetical protein